ncbi:MAG: hypothetical protein JXB03_04995 [Spirochaetales bacterium]|nr:hypothetical protein [Spirochaetales bacterium]
MAHLQHVFRFSFCHLTPGPAGGITVRPLVARTVRHDSCCRGSEQLSVHSTLQENGILTLEIKTKEEDRLLSRDCSMRLPLVAASSGRLGSLARMRIDMLEYSGTDPKILEACRALIDSGIQEELVHALLSTEGYIGMSPGPDAQRGGFRYAS